MKVLVIGAAGKTGRAVVQQALAGGHNVNAFVHSLKDYGVQNIKVLEGDATDIKTFEQAVIGHDVVVDTIGGKTPYKTTSLGATTASTIISAMQNKGIKKLIFTSMLGEGESKENTPNFTRLLLSTFLRGANKDKAAMESAVKTSGLDWIILRLAILTDDAATQIIKVFNANSKDKAHKISRKDLAAFIVARIGDDKYLGEAVTIAISQSKKKLF